MTFFEPLEIGHRDAFVEIVRALCQDVLARPWRLAGHDRIDGRIEEERLHPRAHRVEGFSFATRETCARARRGGSSGRERLRRASQDEFTRGQVVVRSRIQPEQLRVPLDLGKRLRRNAGGVRQDLLEHLTHLEIPLVALVVVDVASGERRLIEVVDQGLLVEGQFAEPVRIQLDDRRVVYSLEQVWARVDLRGRGGRAHRASPRPLFRGPAAAVRPGSYMAP